MAELELCPFCGGEASKRLFYKGKYRVHCNVCDAYSGDVCDTEAEAIEAWNTRATGGTLTAEQVREAVMSADRWEKPMGNTGLTNTHLIIRDDGWQAIAEELNSRAERTCRIVKTWSDSDYVDDWRYRCSECGCNIPVNERDPETGDVISAANYCPNCGARVVGE